MIAFSCPCGYRFSLPDDMAGGLTQCPRCRRLVDVPSLSDLQSIAEDGTFKLEDAPVLEEEHRIERLREAFARRRVDDAGQEIDLRPTLSEVRLAGEPGAPVGPARTPRRYDPETGELILPLDVRAGAPGPGLPKERPPGAPIEPVSVVAPATLGPWNLLLELFKPVNLVVMLFVLMGYALGQFVADHPYLFMGMHYFAVVFILLVMALSMAHYAVTVEETGPHGLDELPRPLRDFDFGDDLWRPLCNALGAVLVAYWPVLLYRELGSRDVPLLEWIRLAALILGSVGFPAVFLTFTSSGATLVNLRPDRVIGVMRHGGSSYWLAMATWFLAGGLTYWIVFGAPLGAGWIGRLVGVTGLTLSGMQYAVLAITVYLTHWFCWQLGLVYRRHHEAFPWAYQRHIPVNRIAEQAREAAGGPPGRIE